MNWRWYLFWIRDFFMGGEIKKAYEQIKKAYYEGNKNEAIIIENLLKHAKETTKYYREISGNKIEEFPIVNKKVIIDNYEEFLSNKYKNKKIHKMSTSGSTGTPFTIVQDMNKRKRVLAELLFFGKIGNYSFGEKQLFLRAWRADEKRKSESMKFLQNMIAEDISIVDNKMLNKIEGILNNNKNLKNITGYANAVGEISEYLNKKHYKPENFNVTSIITGSEMLEEATRQKIMKVFGCEVLSRYSNQENGVLAQECITNKEFHLNTADYYFEFLKLDEDVPAEEGELSRIVVTDLYNYAMPLIRYDTGDLAIVGNSKCDINVKVIKEVYGRRADLIYDTAGHTVSPHAIFVTVRQFENIKQYKFVQVGKKEYKVIINKREGFNSADGIINKLKKLLGENAKIIIEYIDEIPVLSSGKRKIIESFYIKQDN